MQKREAEEVLKTMMQLLIAYLEELSILSNGEGREFEYGERVAYTECLEWIQLWKDAEKFGLDFDVEKRFPL